MKLPSLFQFRILKEVFRAVTKGPYTTKYPFGKPEIHPRFKGRPKVQDTCVGCSACLNWCPSGAIEEINDLGNRKRKIIWHFDHCIMCGECERICTTGDGVKMVPEFELAGFKREEMIDFKEYDLLLCERCGEIISTRAHLLWMLNKIGEKQVANLAYLNEKLKELGIIEKTKKKITLNKRDDLFSLLCPKCRHQIIIYDSI